MTPQSIDDVAAYVVDSFPAPVSTMKLQKLCYMAQGWTLAITDDPLFCDEFEAWKNGPVSARLFRSHRGKFLVEEWPHGSAQLVSPLARAILDGVVKNYGGLSGIQLSALTHQPGTPWSRAREQAGVSDGGWARTVISKDDMKHHFKRLLGIGKEGAFSYP